MGFYRESSRERERERKRERESVEAESCVHTRSHGNVRGRWRQREVRDPVQCQCVSQLASRL